MDAGGFVYWTQETDDGSDRMFSQGSNDVPHLTGLTSVSIAAALGETSGRGSIQSIAASGNDIYFYLHGRSGRRLLACMGRYSPKEDKITLVADTTQLQALTGAAGRFTQRRKRGQTVVSGPILWVWLHHLDSWWLGAVDLTHVDANKRGEFAHCHSPALQTDAADLLLNRDDYQLGGSAATARCW